MNIVTIMGRLTRDPIQRMAQTANGSLETSNFTVAVSRNRKNENGEYDADFISCVAFGKRAEFANKYLTQGMRVCIDGRIQTGKYTNKEGQTVYTTDIVVNNIEFADSKKAGSDNNSGNTGGFTDIPDSIDDAGLPFK